MSVLNLTALTLSAVYMGNFWNPSKQIQIPFLQNFNEAIRGSELMVRCLRELGVSWTASVALWWFQEVVEDRALGTLVVYPSLALYIWRYGVYPRSFDEMAG
jgi:hypothetical protein